MKEKDVSHENLPRLKLKLISEVLRRKKCAKNMAPTTSMPYLQLLLLPGSQISRNLAGGTFLCWQTPQPPPLSLPSMA